MTHKELIDALIGIAEATAGLEHDNGATQSIQDLIAALEANEQAVRDVIINGAEAGYVS